MKTKFYFNRTIAIVLLAIFASSANAQLSGTVFRDINGDGVRQTSAPNEPGEFGMIIRAYDAGNTLTASTTTNAAGYYSFSGAQVPTGQAVRLEFIIKAGDQPSKRIAGNRSNVQFVISGPATVNIDFAVGEKKTFTNNSNPYVVTTGYTNGDPVSNGPNTAGDRDALYVFPYDLLSDGGSTRRAKNQFIGSVFGLAWQRESRTLLMGAYLKRHSGFGPGGIDAVYQSQIDATGVPAAPTLLLNLSTVGINVGANPRTSVLPILCATPNTDDGVFAEVGKRGIGSMDLSNDGRDLYLINMYEKKLQRVNVGNPLKAAFSPADLTGSWSIPGPGITGTSWRPMSVEVHNGKAYVGGVTTRETGAAHDYTVDNVDLNAVVYELDLDNPAAVFVEVLRFPLTYRRGFLNNDFRYEFRNNSWNGWQNSGDIGIIRTGINPGISAGNAVGVYYPQLMLSNIEFDVDGSMILGIRDRFGDQGGFANYFETGNLPGEAYRTLANGEVLKAGKAGAIWQIENNGSVTTNGVTTTSIGLTASNPAMTGSYASMTGTPWGGNYGPGGGYFYYNHNYTRAGVPAPFDTDLPSVGHYLKSNGGLLVFPGYDEVLGSAIDPVSAAYTNGIIRHFSQGPNAGNMSGRMQLIGPPTSFSDPSTMGKAAALGDLELLLDAQVMEIGNLVWFDGNGNGRQDAGENGIANVSVVLRSPGADGAYNSGDDQTWTAVTDANGNYYFDAAIVNDSRRPNSWIGVSATNSGVLPGFAYRLEINPTQPSINGLLLVGTHYTSDVRDNDGSLTGGLVKCDINPGGSTATSSIFENNYNVDFGFSTTVLSVTDLQFSGTLKETLVELSWNTTQEKSVQSYTVERSVNGGNFTAIGYVGSKGDGNFSYIFKDDISALTGKMSIYRLRIDEKSGVRKYSSNIKFQLNQSVRFDVGPNPFTNNLTVQLYSKAKSTASIRLTNMSGQVVYAKNFSVEKGMNGIAIGEFQSLAKGMYMIEAKTESFIVREKLLKR